MPDRRSIPRPLFDPAGYAVCEPVPEFVITFVQAQSQVETDLVALYKALGGGWQDAA